MTEINILIADDHKVFADGLQALLKEQAVQVKDVYVASDAATATKILVSTKIAIAFIDIEFGETDGRMLAAELSKKNNETQYIALSSHSEPQIIKSALKGAFRGYILKTDSLATIISCIDDVLAGKTFVSPDCNTALLNDVTGNTAKSFVPKLTRREKEVLECIAGEMSTKDIAAHLFISEKTVEVHRSNLMLKMDVKNMAGLIRRAFETGLLN